MSAGAYRLGELLFEGDGLRLCRAVRRADGCPVLLRMAPGGGERAAAGLRREYELRAELDWPGVVRPLALEIVAGAPTLVLEDFGGVTLTALGFPLALPRFCELAAAVAARLAEVHGRGLLHTDVRPPHILVDPATGATRLTGFGLAARAPREQQILSDTRLLAGALPYLSPEGTGRINRSVDARSDLYALGVTLYQALTGALPFQARDALEWVHCHIARRPVPPGDVVPALAPPTAPRRSSTKARRITGRRWPR
ncbi:MAG TPA: protein kinase [Polyangia bacterium]